MINTFISLLAIFPFRLLVAVLGLTLWQVIKYLLLHELLAQYASLFLNIAFKNFELCSTVRCLFS